MYVQNEEGFTTKKKDVTIPWRKNLFLALENGANIDVVIVFHTFAREGFEANIARTLLRRHVGVHIYGLEYTYILYLKIVFTYQRNE